MLYLFLFLISSLSSFAETPPLSLEDAPHTLVIHNRILAKVNGKTISVIDVMKNMDVYLNRAYPHLAHTPLAKHQFFSSNWRSTLAQMIDAELMMADAELIELKVSDGDIRETLQGRFGPNIMTNLDKLGMSYEEAWKMIHAELTVQRMTWYRINSKAIQNVNPKDIKTAYRQYCLLHPPEEKWKYQVLSIRCEDQQISTELSHKAYAFLLEEKRDFSLLVDILKQLAPPHPSLAITASPDYELSDKQLSSSHKKILLSLQPGSYSKPIPQQSRADKGMVQRIFYLKEHFKTHPPLFEQIADELQDSLIQEAISKESSRYLAKLKERFGYDEKALQEELAHAPEPFSLQ